MSDFHDADHLIADELARFETIGGQRLALIALVRKLVRHIKVLEDRNRDLETR